MANESKRPSLKTIKLDPDLPPQDGWVVTETDLGLELSRLADGYRVAIYFRGPRYTPHNGVLM